jgi:hypothetical protein
MELKSKIPLWPEMGCRARAVPALGLRQVFLPRKTTPCATCMRAFKSPKRRGYISGHKLATPQKSTFSTAAAAATITYQAYFLKKKYPKKYHEQQNLYQYAKMYS